MVVNDTEGEEIAKTVQDFIQSLAPTRNPTITFHKNYVRSGTIFEEGEIGRLLDAILGNSQISYASGTSNVLLEIFKMSTATLPASRHHWERFVTQMTDQHDGKAGNPYSYPSIRAKLDAA